MKLLLLGVVIGAVGTLLVLLIIAFQTHKRNAQEDIKFDEFMAEVNRLQNTAETYRMTGMYDDALECLAEAGRLLDQKKQEMNLKQRRSLS